MRRWAKVLARILIVVVAVPLLFAAIMYGSAWYYRWRAGQLLAVIQTMTPGITTEADYARALDPVKDHLTQITTYGTGNIDVPLPGGFGLGNHPEWVYRTLYSDRLEALRGPIGRMMPFDTAFMVMPKFTDGKLSGLEIHEEQGEGHPFGAFVTISATQYEKEDPMSSMPPFGYRVSHLGENLPLWETFVIFDERASRAERNSALDFSFRCFTRFHECRDAAMFLQPAPSRPRPDDMQ